jgi:hypothetical protein
MLRVIDSRLVKRHCGGIVSDDNTSAAKFIKELTDLRERTSSFPPDPLFLTQSEMSDIIYYVATIEMINMSMNVWQHFLSTLSFSCFFIAVLKVENCI